MAETPDIPQSLQAIIKVLNSLGPDLQIPYRKGKVQRFISGDQLVPIFNEKSRVWDIGYQSKGGSKPTYEKIPGASLPLGSYGDIQGKPAILNIPGTASKTLAGASIIDRAVAALEDPSTAKRVASETGFPIDKVKANLRSNFASPIRSAGLLTDLIFPPGRNPDVGERKKLDALLKAGLISQNEDGKFVQRSKPLTKEENIAAMEIMRPGSTTGTRAPSTPSLSKIDPKQLLAIVKDLPSEPPTAIDTRDTRQAKAEAAKYQAQRDAEEGKRPEFRGTKPASPGQKDMIESLLASLKKKDPNAYLKFLQQNPQFREQVLTKKGPLPAGPLSKAAEDKLNALNLLVQVGSTGGVVRLGGEGRRAGISVVRNEPPLASPQPILSSLTTGETVYGPGNYITKGKASALINSLMTLGQPVPESPNLATGAEALSRLPRLPAQGVGGADVEAAAGASRFAGAQPLAMTPEQAGMPVEEKAAAREIIDVSRKIQRGFTKEQETKLLGDIDKTIKAMGEAAPANALEKAKLTIRLAKKLGAFGTTSDLNQGQSSFVDMMVARTNRIRADLGSADPKTRDSATRLVQLLNKTGFAELDPKSVAEQAKYIWTLNTAGAAARAIDLHRRNISPEERDITSRRLEPTTGESGIVGGKIATAPTILNPMQLSDYAATIEKAGRSRQVQETDRRAVRGERRVIPAGGLTAEEASSTFTPGIPNPGDIQGQRLQQNAASTMRYQELVRLAQQKRVANMPEPADVAAVARGRMAGQPRRVGESLLVRMMGH